MWLIPLTDMSLNQTPKLRWPSRLVCAALMLAMAPALHASGLLGLGASAQVDAAQPVPAKVPDSAPQKVWVTAFATDPMHVQTDPGGPLARRRALAGDSDSASGNTPQGLRGALRESLGDVRKGLRGDGDNLVGEDAATVAEKAAVLLQTQLIEALKRQGIPAQAWDETDSWPDTGVLLNGQFISIDEGSQLKRTVIGLGAGQSYLSTQGQLYRTDEAQAGPFLTFHTSGDSGMAPGLLVGGAVGQAVTGAAAVGAGASGLRGSRKGTADDLRNTAASIAQYLADYWKTRNWVESVD